MLDCVAQFLADLLYNDHCSVLFHFVIIQRQTRFTAAVSGKLSFTVTIVSLVALLIIGIYSSILRSNMKLSLTILPDTVKTYIFTWFIHTLPMLFAKHMLVLAPPVQSYSFYFVRLTNVLILLLLIFMFTMNQPMHLCGSSGLYQLLFLCYLWPASRFSIRNWAKTVNLYQ